MIDFLQPVRHGFVRPPVAGDRGRDHRDDEQQRARPGACGYLAHPLVGTLVLGRLALLSFCGAVRPKAERYAREYAVGLGRRRRLVLRAAAGVLMIGTLVLIWRWLEVVDPWVARVGHQRMEQ